MIVNRVVAATRLQSFMTASLDWEA